MRYVLLLATLVVGCGDGEAEQPLVIPDEPVSCGAGRAGQLTGTILGADGTAVAFGTPAPAWRPSASDAPSILTIVPVSPGLVMYGVTDPGRLPPSVGERNGDTAVVLDGNLNPMTRTTHVVIDDSDGATPPVCVAGRFDLTFDRPEATGHVVGWFRTR